jgi:3-phosphoshikimate 1-carboxyvinyltransferase
VTLEASTGPEPARPVRPRGPLSARLRVPGSRSITNRALLCAALADGHSSLTGATPSDDTEAMREGLRALGVSIQVGADAWEVTGTGGRFPASGAEVDVRSSGTTARFLTAAATLAAGPTTLDGTAQIRRRPLGDLADALGALGAGVTLKGEAGGPPVVVAGGGLPGGHATIDASRSSQFLSGILLAAPCAERDIDLTFAGGVLVSRAFAELTAEVMTAFGADVELTATRARVRAGAGYRARQYAIEPDAQAAVYPLAAAAIAGGRVLVEGIPPESQQTDLRLLEILERMGCRVERSAEGIALEGPEHTLRAVDADLNSIPDATLALAVVALFADGPSLLRNLGHLPIKESDRLAALRTELSRLGARVEAGPDWLRIEPGPLHGVRVATYDDHRMAMSFALAGLRIPGVEIANPGCVAKTWPDFFDALERL